MQSTSRDRRQQCQAQPSVATRPGDREAASAGSISARSPKRAGSGCSQGRTPRHAPVAASMRTWQDSAPVDGLAAPPARAGWARAIFPRATEAGYRTLRPSHRAAANRRPDRPRGSCPALPARAPGPSDRQRQPPAPRPVRRSQSPNATAGTAPRSGSTWRTAPRPMRHVGSVLRARYSGRATVVHCPPDARTVLPAMPAPGSHRPGERVSHAPLLCARHARRPASPTRSWRAAAGRARFWSAARSGGSPSAA